MVAAKTLPGWDDAYGMAAAALLIGAVWFITVLLLSLVKAAFAPKAASKPVVLVDGSNVMHWKDNTPKIETLREVVYALSDHGFKVGVMFDANAGYKLFDRYHHDSQFAGLLGMKTDHVMVVPKGTPADPYLLNAARDMGARIVTDDRFRDWAETYPEVQEPGHLIRGGYRNGKLWLDLQQSVKNAA